MNEPINWPAGEFTIEALVGLNPAFPETVIRKKLSAAISARTIVQTQKGDRKIKGKFQVLKPVTPAGI